CPRPTPGRRSTPHAASGSIFPPCPATCGGFRSSRPRWPRSSSPVPPPPSLHRRRRTDVSDLTDATGLAADPLAESSSLRKLRETVRTLVRDISPEERVLQLDEDEVFDQELFAALGAEGLTALGGDASLGGSGDIREQAVVIEELG